MRIFSLIIILAVVSGCSQKTSNTHNATAPASPAYWTPTNLARLIAGADNIVVTNSVPNTHFRLSISGSEVGKIVQAASSSKAYPNWNLTGSLFEWRVQFCKATKVLATIDCREGGFLYGGDEYIDSTGTIEALAKRCESKR